MIMSMCLSWTAVRCMRRGGGRCGGSQLQPHARAHSHTRSGRCCGACCGAPRGRRCGGRGAHAESARSRANGRARRRCRARGACAESEGSRGCGRVDPSMQPAVWGNRGRRNSGAPWGLPRAGCIAGLRRRVPGRQRCAPGGVPGAGSAMRGQPGRVRGALQRGGAPFWGVPQCSPTGSSSSLELAWSSLRHADWCMHILSLKKICCS